MAKYEVIAVRQLPSGTRSTRGNLLKAIVIAESDISAMHQVKQNFLAESPPGTTITIRSCIKINN